MCKNDAATGSKSGRLAFAPGTTTIYPVDLNYSRLGTVMPAGGGGYWIIDSDIRTGQPANANGLADVHLLHVASTVQRRRPTRTSRWSATRLNDRAPHLARVRQPARCSPRGRLDGDRRLLAERGRTPDVASRSSTRRPACRPGRLDGGVGGPAEAVAQRARQPLPGLPRYPDGSVAYPAPGTSGTKIKILRVLP